MKVSPEILVKLRQERGWTQEKLATVAGISERTVQRAEKDGSCSLDTKMAFATVFDISPTELTTDVYINLNSEYSTSYGGIIGLLIFGLCAPILVLLTGVNGHWELISLFIVIVFTVALSFIKFGIKTTHCIFEKTSWLVRFPKSAPKLPEMIKHANAIIEYAYSVGIIASIAAALTISVHAPTILSDNLEFLLLVIRPFFYSGLFVELWFRPYKHRLESMLAKQADGT